MFAKRPTFVLVFAIAALVLVAPARSYTQRSAGERSSERKRIISLVKNARKNGYEESKNGKRFYIRAMNVVDPLTKKLLEGVKELTYRCPKTGKKRRTALFSKGYTQRMLVACPLILEPRLILLDESDSN